MMDEHASDRIFSLEKLAVGEWPRSRKCSSKTVPDLTQNVLLWWETCNRGKYGRQEPLAQTLVASLPHHMSLGSSSNLIFSSGTQAGRAHLFWGPQEPKSTQGEVSWSSCQHGFSCSFLCRMEATGFDIVHSPPTRSHAHTSKLPYLLLNLQD